MAKHSLWVMLTVVALAACTQPAKRPSTAADTPTASKSEPDSAKRETAPQDLVRTITDLDIAYFDAYNSCELEKFESFMDENIEFYHDEGGLSLGSEKLKEAVRKNICGKTRRELVPGTLNVYLMRGYGALEEGIHLFYSLEHTDEPVEEARFIHLWENRDGKWKIVRAISYDHHLLPK